MQAVSSAWFGCLVRVPGPVAVEEDGVGVAVAADLPDRECPFGVVAEVLDAGAFVVSRPPARRSYAYGL